jgi:hypothetical protein
VGQASEYAGVLYCMPNVYPSWDGSRAVRREPSYAVATVEANLSSNSIISSPSKDNLYLCTISLPNIYAASTYSQYMHTLSQLMKSYWIWVIHHYFPRPELGVLPLDTRGNTILQAYNQLYKMGCERKHVVVSR